MIDIAAQPPLAAVVRSQVEAYLQYRQDQHGLDPASGDAKLVLDNFTNWLATGSDERAENV